MEKKEIHLTLVAERDTVFELKFPGEVSELKGSLSNVLGSSEHGNRYRTVKLEKGDKVDALIMFK